MLGRLTCLISVVFVLGLWGSMAGAQENQIVNGEFDDALNGWGTYGAAGFNLDVVQGAGLSGKNAAIIDVFDASVATAIGMSQGGLQLVQGQTYQIGFTAKAEEDREMILLFQIYNPAIPQWLTPFEQTVQLTTEPQSFNFGYTHDTETTAEHPDWSVDIYLMLKGAWWTIAGDDLNKKVWIDRVYFGAETPRQSVGGATEPFPADGAFYEDTWLTLRWSPGDYAVSHDVYLGENFDDVNDGTGGTFQGNHPEPHLVVGFPGFPYPDGLVPGTTYYWRVDEVNDLHPDSPWKGPVWSFTVPPKKAYVPNPPDGVKFVSPDVTLSWTVGFGARLHHLYFGDNAADVDAGTGGTYKGPVVNAKFATSGLEHNRTYYWRVDEFDGLETHTGDLWSFTVAKEGGGVKGEYFDNATLTGDPVLVRMDPQIDFDWGSGDIPGENSPAESINVDNFSARWSGELEVDLTDTYTFHITANNGFKLWMDGGLIIDYWDNPTTSSRASEPMELIGGGSHSIRMEYSEGTGAAIAQLFWESSFRDRQIIPQAALSPPIKANSPSPASGAAGVPMDLVLTWGAGDFAASHDVYLGTDPEAVANATKASPEFKASKALGDESYDPGPLGWGATYYWRVDEVNDVHPDSPWIGNVWSFTTVDYLTVDDFESYTDDDAANEAIWQHWIDGFGVANNGAQVGYLLPPYAEQTIVHGGVQSMPFFYNNTDGVTNSEALLMLTAPRDWTQYDVTELSLWFRGYPASVGGFMEGPVGTYTMTGSGADIWDVADQFHYVSKTLTGAGTISVQVRSLQNTSGWAKAGVMIRETLDPGSKHAFACMTPANGVAFQGRNETGNTSFNTNQTGIAVPHWLKLERDVSGNFTVAHSANGTTWSPIQGAAPRNISMSSTVYIGLAVCSTNAAQTCEAVFSNVTTTGSISGQWTGRDIGIASNAAEPMYVAISSGIAAPAVVVHDDPAAATIDTWTQWRIPLQAFADQGINLANVDSIAIGLGTKGDAAAAGGSGQMYFDDIVLYRPWSD